MGHPTMQENDTAKLTPTMITLKKRYNYEWRIINKWKRCL